MAEQKPVRIAVAGATGYTGAELVRLLLDHPYAELTLLSSERAAGQPVGRLLPAVRNHPGVAAATLRPLAELPEVDIVFACLPGGSLPARMPLLAERAKYVVNLAGDFRLRDAGQAARHYPESAGWDEPFAYHVPEFSAAPEHRFLNLPGCMAVASLYALYPLLQDDLVEDRIVVDAKTGSSGGGKDGGEHPADRFGNFRPHRLHGHRHAPEVAQALGDLTGRTPSLQFSTFSLDVARGILVTAYTTLRDGRTALDVRRAYARAYARTPFVAARPSPKSAADLPSLKSVVGSNVAEVGFQVRGSECVSVATLDNLLKGAAGQAVQTMNQVFGFDQATGLPRTAVAP
ncbi:N-acetyl-gamma-glutamyl-phosphate reductase [Amycolatopsis sp. NEAU-NG30]|uniref:N-acetyl-gamma-glutamyl-phosphate reductase n=1 Tax=Amycolatopsis melonis TaxID=3156488 RepID=A0ABV0LRA5_9PSEU